MIAFNDFLNHVSHYDLQSFKKIVIGGGVDTSMFHKNKNRKREKYPKESDRNPWHQPINSPQFKAAAYFYLCRKKKAQKKKKKKRLFLKWKKINQL